MKKATLHVGDVIQIGGCNSKIKLGDTYKSKSNGFAYYVGSNRFKELQDDTNISAIFTATGKISSPNLNTSNNNPNKQEDAFRHFELLILAATENLKLTPLSKAHSRQMFLLAINQSVPFHQWSSWIYSELSKKRFEG